MRLPSAPKPARADVSCVGRWHRGKGDGVVKKQSKHHPQKVGLWRFYHHIYIDLPFSSLSCLGRVPSCPLIRVWRRQNSEEHMPAQVRVRQIGKQSVSNGISISLPFLIWCQDIRHLDSGSWVMASIEVLNNQSQRVLPPRKESR